MSPQLFDRFRQLSDARLYKGVGNIDFASALSIYDVVLPSDHQNALQESNGIETYGGHARLFGFSPESSVDTVKWNEFECWKFAWGSRCQDYLCFAETAWGDQYAYHIGRLREGDARVYFLDSLSMTPEVIAPSFSDFLASEFFRISTEPYDVMTVRARDKFGILDTGSHLVYSPSLLLEGQEDIVNVQILNARVAMIFNGDVASQLDAAPAGSVIRAVVPYDDDAQRPRLKLVWS